MKKLMLLAVLSALSAPGLSAQTVTAPTAAPETMSAPRRHKTPEEFATKDADQAEKKLGLNADQKSKWHAASLQRMNANAPLREKMKASADSSEKKNLRLQLRDNGKKFDDTVNSFLTPDQKTKWEQTKQEKKERHHHKAKMKN